MIQLNILLNKLLGNFVYAWGMMMQNKSLKSIVVDYRGNSNNIYDMLLTTDILRTAKLISTDPSTFYFFVCQNI